MKEDVVRLELKMDIGGVEIVVERLHLVDDALHVHVVRAHGIRLADDVERNVDDHLIIVIVNVNGKVLVAEGGFIAFGLGLAAVLELDAD